MRKRNKNNIKDYIVPIITFILIFVLIYIAFGGSDKNEETNTNNNQQTVENSSTQNLKIKLGDINTEANIIKKNKSKIKAINNSTLSTSEVLVVKKGDISSEIPNKMTFSLDGNKEIGRIKYLENSEVELIASSLWVKTTSSAKIKLKFGDAILGANTIANFKQNEFASTFYLIKGSLEVESKGKKTFLSPGKQIEITNTDYSKDSIDLNLLKSDFKDAFRVRDWTLKNNGGVPLTEEITENYKKTDNLITEQNNLEETNSGSTISQNKKNIIPSNSLLNFDKIYDEGFVETPKTNISGNFIDDSVTSITIDGKSANINMEKKIFNVIGVDTSKKVNDLIVKIYNQNNDLIGKSILTLNYNSGNDNSNNNSFSKINTKPFPVNSSDFIVSIPTVKQGKTFLSENNFYGTVKNPNIKTVKINGYPLKTFNGKTFRYHAYKRFHTLGEGVNNYKIQYLGKDGKIIFEKYVTIEKLSKNKIKKISAESN